MPEPIVEGNLRFSFGASWSVAMRWDDEHREHFCDYLKLNGQLDGRPEGTKAVDIVAVDSGRGLWLIELKDFEGYLRDNQERLASGELYLEVALKARDSVAGVVGLCALGETPLRAALHGIAEGGAIHVVLWLECDGPPRKRPRNTPDELKTRTDALKARLRWLTRRVLVVDRHTHQGRDSIPDLAVEFINRPAS